MKSRSGEKFGHKQKTGAFPREPNQEFVINAILMFYRQRAKFLDHFAPKESRRLTDDAMTDQRLKRPFLGRILFDDRPMFVYMVSSPVNDVNIGVELKNFQHATQRLWIIT